MVPAIRPSTSPLSLSSEPVPSLTYFSRDPSSQQQQNPSRPPRSPLRSPSGRLLDPSSSQKATSQARRLDSTRSTTSSIDQLVALADSHRVLPGTSTCRRRISFRSGRRDRILTLTDLAHLILSTCYSVASSSTTSNEAALSHRTPDEAGRSASLDLPSSSSALPSPTSSAGPKRRFTLSDVVRSSSLSRSGPVHISPPPPPSSSSHSAGASATSPSLMQSARMSVWGRQRRHPFYTPSPSPSPSTSPGPHGAGGSVSGSEPLSPLTPSSLASDTDVDELYGSSGYVSSEPELELAGPLSELGGHGSASMRLVDVPRRSVEASIVTHGTGAASVGHSGVGEKRHASARAEIHRAAAGGRSGGAAGVGGPAPKRAHSRRASIHRALQNMHFPSIHSAFSSANASGTSLTRADSPAASGTSSAGAALSHASATPSPYPSPGLVVDTPEPSGSGLSTLGTTGHTPDASIYAPARPRPRARSADASENRVSRPSSWFSLSSLSSSFSGGRRPTSPLSISSSTRGGLEAWVEGEDDDAQEHEEGSGPAHWSQFLETGNVANSGVPPSLLASATGATEGHGARGAAGSDVGHDAAMVPLPPSAAPSRHTSLSRPSPSRRPSTAPSRTSSVSRGHARVGSVDSAASPPTTAPAAASARPVTSRFTSAKSPSPSLAPSKPGSTRTGSATSTTKRPTHPGRKLSKPSDAQVLREWEEKRRVRVEEDARARAEGKKGSRRGSWVGKLFANADY